MGREAWRGLVLESQTLMALLSSRSRLHGMPLLLLLLLLLRSSEVSMLREAVGRFAEEVGEV